jgi:murein DD-endopeptidase MepM/ murein hydrolase activator NlpD
VVRWDEDAEKWKGQYPGTDGTNNTDYLVWGKPLYAVADGVVESLVNHIADQEPGVVGSSANTVKIRVGDEVVMYLHLRQFSIPAKLKVGDFVAAGQKIGEVGNSGHSTSPHLHFGVRHAPAGMSSNMRPSLFRNIHLIDRTRFDPDHVSNSSWEPVNGKSLTWVKNAIWPSSVAPSETRIVVR